MTAKRIILILLASVILTLGVSLAYNVQAMELTLNSLANSTDFVWLIICAFFALMINYLLKIKNKRLLVFSFINGTVLSVLNVIGFTFTYYILSDIDINLKMTIYLIIKFLSCSVIFGSLSALLFNFIDNVNIKEKAKSKLNNLFVPNKRNFLILALIIFLAYIPWLLHYFPGICSADSAVQMLQVTGNTALTNHHPIFHTLIIGLCLNIGNLLFGSNNAGIAIYSIIQMLACAFTFSFAVLYLHKKQVPALLQKLLLLFFMFCPIVCSYSLTMWKDIPFALCVLITTILLVEACTNQDKFFKKKSNLILLGVFFMLDILFRKNGLYCVLLGGVVLLIFLPKKCKKQILLPFLIPVICSFIITGPIFSAFDIKDGNSKEALSVIMQQFARIRKYHDDDLSKSEKKKLDSFFDDDSYMELYNPTFADPVKRVFSEEYLQDHKIDAVTTYLEFVFKYPKDTIIAFIAGSYGYYYPNLVGWEVFSTIYNDDETEVLDIEQTPIVYSPIIKELNVFLNSHNIPLLSMLTSCGFYLWTLITIICYTLYKKRYMLLCSFSVLLGVFLTALLSPVFCERRYVYSLIITVPVLFCLCFFNKNKKVSGLSE